MHGSTSCSTVCARRDCSGCRNRTEREWKHSLQSVEKQHFDSCASCGSTHKIEFAKQIHKFREHGPDHPLLPLCGNSPCVSRNLYKGRKNVPVRARFFFSIRSKAWFRARGCSKNDSFSTASEDCKRSPLFYAQAVHYSSMMVVKVRVSLSFGCNLRIPCLCSMAWSR